MTKTEENVQNTGSAAKEEQIRGKERNTAVSEVRTRAERIFGGQSSDIAKLMLLASAGLSAVYDSPAAAAAVMVLVTADAAAGLIRERRCISSSERIRRAAEPAVMLRRDGDTFKVPACDIKQGDIFEIGEGGIFPCDSLIIEQQELCCDESTLTGNESPAEKTAYSGEKVKERLGLAYVGYSGTVVTHGRAVCKAEGHGSEAFRHEPAERTRTSLLVTDSRRRAERIFTGVCAGLSAAVTAAGIIGGGGITRSLSLGMAAAAVCIPERLTAAAELCSSKIRRLLYAKGMIVKDTEALERLGETELILADLRGTVTERARNVKKLYIPADSNGEYDYSELTGRLTFGRNEDSYMAWENSALGETMICAAVCSRARRVRGADGSHRNRRTRYEGDSDDTALLALCSACGIDREMLLMNKLSERPNDPAESCISVTCRVLGGELRIYAKGSARDIFTVCEGVYGTDDPDALFRAKKKAEDMAEDGFGVIAFCETVGGRTLLLGLAGLWSPIPEQAAGSVKALRRMGVRTVMFTADERKTAKAAAASAGILTEGKRCCTGGELDAMTDEQIEAVSGTVTVFSQTMPRHKARVAAVSDAMKCGCAVSVSDREEAALMKETQALIFACDSLPESVKQQAEVIVPQGCMEELAGAVKCGRALYGALRGRACLGIELAATVMIMLLAAAVMGMSAPLLPVQLLLAALITEPAAAEALTMIPASGRLYKPLPPNDDCFVGRRLFSVHFIRGLFTAFSLLGCFTVLLRTGSLPAARTGVTAAFGLSRLFSVVRLCGTDKIAVKTAAAVLLSAAALAACVTIPFLSGLFGSVHLSAKAVAVSAAFSLLPSLITSLPALFGRKRIG